MSSICLFFCGGTIAMVRNSATGALEPAGKTDRLTKLLPELHELMDIDFVPLFDLDSTNMTPMHWTTIARAISERADQYDGFVVTQGTDSMAYSASAISFALAGLGKPIVFTGSLMPMDMLGTDARNNFTYACRIATMDIGEVVILFGTKILRANRTTKSSESMLNAMSSPHGFELGEIRAEIKLSPHRIRRVSSVTKNFSPVIPAEAGIHRYDFDPNILAITITPGMSPEILTTLLEKNVHGLVLEGFGPGNVPNAEGISLVPIIRDATARGIPVVITSQCEHGTVDLNSYAVGRSALDAGAIPAGDMTRESAITKLMWALGQTRDLDAIKKIIPSDISGERTVS